MQRRSRSAQDLKSTVPGNWSQKIFNAELIIQSPEAQKRTASNKGMPVIFSSVDPMKSMFNHPLLYAKMNELDRLRKPDPISTLEELKKVKTRAGPTLRSKKNESPLEEKNQKSLSLHSREGEENREDSSNLNLRRPISGHYNTIHNVHRAHPPDPLAYTKTFSQSAEAFAPKSNFRFLDLAKFIRIEEPSFSKNIPQGLKYTKYHLSRPILRAYHKKLRPRSEEREAINFGSNIYDSRIDLRNNENLESMGSTMKYKVLADMGVGSKKNFSTTLLLNNSSSRKNDSEMGAIFEKYKFEGQSMKQGDQKLRDLPKSNHAQVFIKHTNNQVTRIFSSQQKNEEGKHSEARRTNSRSGNRSSNNKTSAEPLQNDPKTRRINMRVDKMRKFEEDMMPKPWPVNSLQDSFDEF